MTLNFSWLHLSAKLEDVCCSSLAIVDFAYLQSRDVRRSAPVLAGQAECVSQGDIDH